MGKKTKKTNSLKTSKWQRTCERCGNGGITKKSSFICRYCGWRNGIGIDDKVVITRGGLDSDR